MKDDAQNVPIKYSEKNFDEMVISMLREIGKEAAIEELLAWAFCIVGEEANGNLEQKTNAMEKFKIELGKVMALVSYFSK